MSDGKSQCEEKYIHLFKSSDYTNCCVETYYLTKPCCFYLVIIRVRRAVALLAEGLLYKVADNCRLQDLRLRIM